MAKKRDYSKWTKEELIRHIKALEKRKKYGLVWDEEREPEKVVLECKEKFPVLKEIKSKAINNDPDKPTHILIEGDNYHALSVLNYTHEKAIDVIYIDPPYNTGNKDFIFNDKYVDSEDSYKHSKWCSFIETRLKLAKNLLKETGIIFFSIDDNEQAQIKLICDEIFSEKNFIANIIWRKKYGGGKGTRFFVDLHEYILCYAKNINKIKQFLLKRSTSQKEIFNKKDKYFNERGKYYIRPLKSGLAHRKNLIYPITCPDGNIVKTQWICAKETFKNLLKKDRIIFKKLRNGRYNVYKKFYENDKGGLVHPESIFYDIAYNQNGKEEIKEIFNIIEGRDVPFENAKPTKLIMYLLKFVNKGKSIKILDFMAGSGTTGHAVTFLNSEDGGNRQFILCTNNENGIAQEVCYPRIKNVLNDTKNKTGKIIDGYKENLKYFKTNFVPSNPTDRNKEKLTTQSVEMLCLRENTFDFVTKKHSYQIFKNKVKYTGIIFDQLDIPKFKKSIKKYEKPVSVYVFSLGDDDFADEFEDMKKKVKVCSIPEAILRVYRRIFK